MSIQRLKQLIFHRDSKDQPSQVDQDRHKFAHADRFLSLMANTSPWAVSLFIHAIVLIGLVFILKVAPHVQRATIAEAFLADQQLMEFSPAQNPLDVENIQLDPVIQRAPAPKRINVPDRPAGVSRKIFSVAQIAPVSVAMAPLETRPVGGQKPTSSLYGTGGDAWNVVYVIDRSGSMQLEFERVCREVVNSLARLSERQKFHVILFGKDRTLENPPGKLIPATLKNKLAAASYLQSVTAEGSTTALPSLQRAFEVLSAAPRNSSGKLIYFLTDGLFEGHEIISSRYLGADGTIFEGNSAMIAWLRDHNRSRSIQVNTYLYDTDGSASPQSVSVMRQLAGENGGLFKHIRRR